MKGYSTTYWGIFEGPDDGQPAISSIEIPIIQRDYAQGREDEGTAAIRRDFLEVLVRALTSNKSEGLDFVYGEVSDGVLKPLDGQQRLTTLFLLHWYVASRAGALELDAPWTRFRYATRRSAEYFCRELVMSPWPQDGSDPVAWITDQPWYLFPWRADPTIQAMLVMIKSIHQRLLEESHDFRALWDRLRGADEEAISFLFLPIDDMESGDDLYIKMNSRGKPLTDFEVFKARLEKLLKRSDRQNELSEKFDREWSDLLWRYEGGNFLVDEEFMNYLSFIIDVCEWRTGSSRSDRPLIDRAERLFVEHDARKSHLDFLFFAFDTWVATNASDNPPADFFAGLLSSREHPGSGVLLFESQNPNLFAASLEHYPSKQFSLAETLFLYAVIVFRQTRLSDGDEVLKTRMRSLRNIAESAPDDVRGEYMSELVASTTKLMTDPAETYLDGLRRFNQGRINDEKLKRDLIRDHPEIRSAVHELEDHELLRGRLFAFNLDPTTLAPRAAAFHEVTADDVLPLLGSALLTKGDYSRSMSSNRRQFGVPGSRRSGGSWRDVFTAGSRESRAEMRQAVDELLDDVANRSQSAQPALSAIVEDWLRLREAAGLYDWRYYFVRYPSMLDNSLGIYVGEYDPAGGGFGYQVDMLRGLDYRSAFTDPYLITIWKELGRPESVIRPEFRSWDNTGSEKAMRLVASGTGVRSLDSGYEVLAPDDAATAELALRTLEPLGITGEGVVPVEKQGPVGAQTDAQDRVQLGRKLVQALVAAGL